MEDDFEHSPSGISRLDQPGPAKWPWVLLLLLLAGGGGAWYWFHRAPAEPAVNLAPPAESKAPVTVPSPAIHLPALDQSDDWVRGQTAGLSSAPQFAAWLAGEQLLRRVTAALAAIANGESPRAPLAVLAPGGGFKVVKRQNRLWIDSASYARYDNVATVVASLNSQTAARFYRLAHPLLEKAFGEIARPDQSLDSAVVESLRLLLDTPVREGEVEVTPQEANYFFADHALESLSPPQKHLLRMGPRNVQLIQAKLRELQKELALR